ncbi:MAG: CRISPR-associated RAMP protein Csx10 [Fimbriimonadales bacterium]|nr:MAG: CRISPR-associated RAMP protein Csx10 [Fimbriimonadales bacterium]
MTRYRLTLKPLSPIAVGEWMTSRSNVRESLSYIPGGVLRGALAQLAMEHIGAHHSSRRTLSNQSQLQNHFQQVFAKDGARFSFLMPFDESWIPAPATALFNKQKDKYLYDTLFALIKGELYEMECPKTRDRLERGRGWLTFKNGEWQKAQLPDKRTFVRVGLNRQTEAAEEGVLYAIEAIDVAGSNDNAGRVFTGFVEFPDAQCQQAFDAILDVLRWRDGVIRLRIGSARSRGFGEVILECVEEAPEPTRAMESLEAFRERAGMPVFTLLVRTPAIVYNACGQPAETLKPEILRHYVPSLPQSVELCPKATRIERELVSGWSGAWGLPKPVQQAFAAGSVFTYTYDPNDTNALQQCLTQLATTPIGARTAEGYGRLIPNSAYHLQQYINEIPARR